MTIAQLASRIAKLEGKKSQARIGDIREVLKITFDILAFDEKGADLLNSEFKKRYDRAKKAKKAKK